MTMKQIDYAKLTTAECTLVNATREYLKANLRGANLKRALEVFAGGVENANDTVFLEKAQPREEWGNMFVMSMAVLLADEGRGLNRMFPEDRKAMKRVKRILEVFAAVKVVP